MLLVDQPSGVLVIFVNFEIGNISRDEQRLAIAILSQSDIAASYLRTTIDILEIDISLLRPLKQNNYAINEMLTLCRRSIGVNA